MKPTPTQSGQRRAPTFGKEDNRPKVNLPANGRSRTVIATPAVKPVKDLTHAGEFHARSAFAQPSSG